MTFPSGAIVRLDCGSSVPWQRVGFRHPDLKGWVREHRGELLWSLLTIARAWFVAGKPEGFVETLGGFESWAKIDGGILAHAGIPAFLQNLDRQGVAWVVTCIQSSRRRFPDGAEVENGLVQGPAPVILFLL